MPTRRTVQRKRDSRSVPDHAPERLVNNPAYRPEAAQEIVVAGKDCINLDGGRLADAAREFCGGKALT